MTATVQESTSQQRKKRRKVGISACIPSWIMIPASMMFPPRSAASCVSAIEAIAPPAAWMMSAVTSAVIKIFASECRSV
jgi:hypothetical protein